MNLHLRRIIFNEMETMGQLFINDKYFCDTLEDHVRIGVKLKGMTAIPTGKYKVVVTMSPKFKRMMPLLCDVPNFSGIRIHRGVSHRHTAGCILVGKMKNLNTLEDGIATEVTLTNLLLRTQSKGEEITILVE